MTRWKLEIFSQLRNFLSSAQADPSPYVLKANSFSRTRVLTFERVVLLILGLLKRSLSVELWSFFDQIDSLEKLCSKSALCQARQKLASGFFRSWNEQLVSLFYQSAGSSIKRWKGFRLCAVDASQIRLPNKEALGEHFGWKHNQFTKVALAKLVCWYDVLNHLCLESYLGPYKEDERDISIAHLPSLSADMLMIYDRHYPSFENIYAHHLANQPFLMRIKRGFNIVEQFLQSGERQSVLLYQIRYNLVTPLRKKGYQVDRNTSVRVRLIRVELASGETEVLISSLLDTTKYPLKAFKWLYQQRWEIEIFFDRIKNKMALENFSGYKVEVIKQEVMAQLFLANVHSLIVEQAKPIVIDKHPNRRLNYQPNVNITIGILVKQIYYLWDKDSQVDVIRKVFEACLFYVEPIRKNRSMPRRRKPKAYRKRHRTQTNFKLAV